MRFILSLFLVLHIITLHAQENHQPISGHVFELIGNDSVVPLVGVNVFYSGTTDGTTTNSAGYFELEHDQSNHMLVFSFVGYQSDTLHIHDDEELNVVLSEGKILEDVVVEFKKGSYTFSRIDPRHAHLIGQDELRKAACCNLAESFETDPSVDATFTDAVTGTKQIQMMGLSGKYVQMLSGNIPVLRGLSLLYGLKQIPGPFIHQIAVSKGAGSVLNGFESMVGQINMNLKQPEYAEKFHLNFYLNQGGRSEYNAFYTHKFKKWSTTFMAHYEDQSIKNDRNQDDFLDMPLHNDFIFHNQWNYRSSKIHMELGYNGAYSNLSSGRIDVEPAYPVNMQIWHGNAFAKIGYLFPNDDFKSLALQLSANLNDQQTTIGLTNFSGRQLSGYANLIFQQELGKNPEENYYKLGASFQVDSVSEILSLRYLNLMNNNTNFYNRRLEMVPGIYGEFTHNSEKWGVIAGLRGDYTSYFDQYFITPRLHIRHSFSNETAIKLMGGSGRRTPFMLMENVGYMASSRQWILDSYGMIGLQQEIAWNFGAALLHEFDLWNREGVFTFDAYRSFFENQLVVDLDQSAREIHFYALNGMSYSNSIQAEINYDINRRISVRTAYRFLDVKTDYQTGLLEKPFVSKHRGFLNMAYSTRKTKGKQWVVDLTTQFIGSQRIPFTGDNVDPFVLDERSPNYVLINGQITRHLGKETSIYLGIENATNFRQLNPILSAEAPHETYFDSALIWGPIFGRMIYFGLRYTIDD